jgi:hypothetical protein
MEENIINLDEKRTEQQAKLNHPAHYSMQTWEPDCIEAMLNSLPPTAVNLMSLCARVEISKNRCGEAVLGFVCTLGRVENLLINIRQATRATLVQRQMSNSTGGQPTAMDQLLAQNLKSTTPELVEVARIICQSVHRLSLDIDSVMSQLSELTKAFPHEK